MLDWMEVPQVSNRHKSVQSTGNTYCNVARREKLTNPIGSGKLRHRVVGIIVRLGGRFKEQP
jgi:hypothetical protein